MRWRVKVSWVRLSTATCYRHPRFVLPFFVLVLRSLFFVLCCLFGPLCSRSESICNVPATAVAAARRHLFLVLTDAVFE